MRLILAGVLALPSFAQGPFTEAVTAAYERVKLNLVETAAAMPEEHYEFRLSPQQRPFSEWLTHTAMGNYSFCAAIRGTQARLTITEGRYHQVRRMFAAVGNHVTALHRDRIGGLALPDELAAGDWRILTADEQQRLFA